MRVDVNLNGVADKAALHERIRKTLPFPDYLGDNLDALADTLLSIKGDTEIAFHEVNPLFTVMPEYMERLLRMCVALEERSPNLRFLFYQ